MFLFPTNRKPDFPVKHKNPTGVVFSYMFDKTIGYDELGRVRLTNSNTDLNRALGSVCASFGSAKTDYLTHPHHSWLDIGDDEWITIRMILTMRDIASSSNQTFMIKGRSSDENVCNYAFRMGSSGDIEFYYNQDTNTVYHVWRTTSSGLLADDVRSVVEFNYQYANASSAEVWVDGVRYGGSWIAGNGTAQPDTGAQDLSFGRKLIGSTEGFHGDIEFAQVERNVAFRPYGADIYSEIFEPDQDVPYAEADSGAAVGATKNLPLMGVG